MAIIDTTDVVESSIFLKAKLKNNLVGDNYYIELLQHKINKEWDYRYNKVDIQEENSKQVSYTTSKPLYEDVEVVIQTVKSIKNQDISNDWKQLIFKDLKHNNFLGKRFRFDLDFEGFAKMSQAQKELNGSIWIGINQEQMSPENGIVVRRCDSNIAMCGSPDLTYGNIKEIHYEPCILETDFKGINIYYNYKVNVPNAEIYAIMQCNYFTQFLKINDRIIVGPGDTLNRENNSAFKIKALTKFSNLHTFQTSTQGIADIPLVLIAMDRDVLNQGDNFETRYPFQGPLYRTIDDGIVPAEEDEKITPGEEVVPGEDTSPEEEITPSEDESEVKTDVIEFKFNDYSNTILQGSFEVIQCTVLNNKEEVSDAVVTLTDELGNVVNKSKYYTIEVLGNNSFKITNIKPYLKGKLILTFTSNVNGKDYSAKVEIELGGFY